MSVLDGVVRAEGPQAPLPFRSVLVHPFVLAALLLSALGAGGAFALSLVNSFKRVISPALVLLFAAVEGVALGAVSKVFDAQFGDGIVTQAVLGTFAAFAGTLAAYKFFNIQIGNKFRTFVVAAMFGTARAFVSPAVRSIPPLVAPEGALPRVMAVYAGTWQIGLIVGPASSGLLYDVDPAVPYAASAACFVVAGIAITSLKVAVARPITARGEKQST